VSLCLRTANCTAAFSARRPLNEVRSTHWPVSHTMTSVLPITASLQLCYYRHVIWSTQFDSWSTWAKLIAALRGFHQYFSTNTVGWHTCAHVRFCTWKHADLICTVCRAFWRLLWFSLSYHWHQALSWNRSLPTLWPSLLIYHSQSAYHSSGTI
jgi:hypothetical protein